ncbi:MAG: thiazole synthase, partial [Vitreoscilla sp.]|nr:thiazole synthase [Polaromonas sp.]
MSDFTVAGTTLSSRLLLGTSHYPSPQILSDAVASSGTNVLTVGLRRMQPESGGGNSFWQRVQAMKCHILPNTAGCHTAEEAITLAQMAREIFGTAWIKLEVIGDDYTLQPDTHATL